MRTRRARNIDNLVERDTVGDALCLTTSTANSPKATIDEYRLAKDFICCCYSRTIYVQNM